MERNQARLKAYLARVLPQEMIERVRSGHEVATEMAEATEAEARGTLPREIGAKADEGMRKILADEEIAPEERFAIEAIVLPRERPVIDILAGAYGDVPAPWEHFSRPAVRDILKPLISSIGRVELPNHPRYPYGGTAFVVGVGLLMTNRHVAEIFASGLGTQGLALRPGIEAGIDFLKERGRNEAQFFRVDRVVMIHPYWDMALLAVPELQGHAALTISSEDPEDTFDREIAVIGYPAFDPRNDAAVQNQVFGGIYNVKRLQPGLLGRRNRIKSFEALVDAVTHDSSTLGGNSGSAVIDVATGKVLALHFAGTYLEANYAVPGAELARDGRIVDAGIRFDRPRREGAPPIRSLRAARLISFQQASAGASGRILVPSLETQRYLHKRRAGPSPLRWR
jgi:hypothetical protein